MDGLRRSGAGPGVTVPPDAADSPPVPAALAQGAARREQRREAAVRRTRRRRRLFVAAAVLVLVSPAMYSYTTWMLQPSSLSASVRSVEWVRAKVPYGNGLVDEIEHVYYSWKAPKRAGRS